MRNDTEEQVLTTLDQHDIKLPQDGLTREKIRSRAFAFQFEANESLSFRIERHPTMYLADMGVRGSDASPARFHVLTEYRLDLSDRTWDVQELDSTFEYDWWMVLEAELGDTGMGVVLRDQIREVRNAGDSEAAFEETFASLIDHWEEKFDEYEGRKVPVEDKEAILELLVETLREEAGVD
ncbi:hypothetical protein SAMN04487948_12412 [Halogranum amylolyticum]|uniref:Uncharacterized protein n=1 Tax=Halogranum amylolyticum TaxID=660520 RepID=A0A1H8W646_9EURY|nr:hypothetical protein [Halogranum amylolyticum]SEP23003.1 hypothetical protein SAMN04487948_12412 [Halogranum amylolyticum]